MHLLGPLFHRIWLIWAFYGHDSIDQLANNVPWRRACMQEGMLCRSLHSRNVQHFTHCNVTPVVGHWCPLTPTFAIWESDMFWPSVTCSIDHVACTLVESVHLQKVLQHHIGPFSFWTCQILRLLVPMSPYHQSWDSVHAQSFQFTCMILCFLCMQLPASDIKKIPGPITPDGPKEVPGMKDLTQQLNSGPLDNGKAETRGLK